MDMLTRLMADSPLGIFVITLVAFIFGMLAWALRDLHRERVRLLCPVRSRPATVVFRLTPSLLRSDVVRCSVFARPPITCGKACLHPERGGV
jgi:hypothetical protein